MTVNGSESQSNNTLHPFFMKMQPNKTTYKTNDSSNNNKNTSTGGNKKNNNIKKKNNTTEVIHDEQKQQQKENKKPTPIITCSSANNNNKSQRKKHPFYDNSNNFIQTRQQQLRQLKQEQQEKLEKYPPESSTSAAKRYARYQQVLKDQQRMIIEQQQKKQEQGLRELSLEEQIQLDFYGSPSTKVEDDTLQKKQQQPMSMQRGPAMWPDKDIYQCGHIRQQEQESTWMDTNVESILDFNRSNNKNGERSTTYVRDIATSRGRAFFESIAIERRQQEQQQLQKDRQNNKKKNDGDDDYKQYAVRDTSTLKELSLSAKKKQQQLKRATMKEEGIELLSHEDIGDLMDHIYPESNWKEIPACQSLYKSLFRDDNDGSDSDGDDQEEEKEKHQLLWTEKHRPTCVNGLLGDHHAYNYLLDWLQQLKVNSRTSEQYHEQQQHQEKGKRRGQNKRQRREEKDGSSSSSELAFEDLSLDEQQQREKVDEWDYPLFSDTDNDDPDFMMERQTRKRGRSRRQVKEQSQKKVESNLMLIFGPHGVGKTASVYTAATQVGYEVFEIHPGMRRAGKDLMALVGEMTESHQVSFLEQQQQGQEGKAQPQQAQQQQQQLPSNQKDISSMFQKTSTITTTSKKRSQQQDDTKEDLMSTKKRRTTTVTKSGAVASTQKKEKTVRSSIMSHFARVKPSTDILTGAEEEDEEEDEKEEMDVDDVDDNEPVGEQRQRIVPTKQSLILLEEVDILYEEDKGFWTAVLELVQKSKRPIIMTCNDTDMVPLDAMKTEKVIEIVPQTTQSLIPYLQLICFKEGYIINPSDLFYLVATMGSDLRQLIHTLEMWCKPCLSIHAKSIHNKMMMTRNGNSYMTAAQQKIEKRNISNNNNKREFRVLPRIFNQYMGIESRDLVLRMTTEPENQQGSDLLELCYLYSKTKDKEHNDNNNMDKKMFAVKHFFNSSDLGAIYRGLETMTFSDSWIIRQQQEQRLDSNHQCQLMMKPQNEVKDQLCGYHGTIQMIGHPIQPELYDIANHIQQLNLKQVMHRKWQVEIQQGAGIWNGLCYSRTTAYNESIEATQGILNWRFVNNPICNNRVMTEYVPYIRAMCQMQQELLLSLDEEIKIGGEGTRRKRALLRSKKNKQRLKINDGSMELLLTKRKEPYNQTYQWHSQATVYNDRWKGVAKEKKLKIP